MLSPGILHLWCNDLSVAWRKEVGALYFYCNICVKAEAGASKLWMPFLEIYTVCVVI